ncbi:MAG: hypothetical protein V3T17_01985 [Pseudomonadales bacterium]
MKFVQESFFRVLAKESSAYPCVVVLESECGYLQLENNHSIYRLRSTRQQHRKFRTLDAAANCAKRLG